ncbi:hypothetical protein A2130_02350 [Candidatus Woesebacteria bacterium GWC2_33_12]|nr:MAG: hypothetical protein A2130_02350 [Candidatus Woesebacteria bacterium GWC2_33_12]OGM85759.1 MAG: hypothetical protein A2616_03525 [Candidatus Woesebacteria bacterium RIFOXYD1_FULL_33_11]
MPKISAVINTYNDEKRLSRTLSSLKGFASEIIVVDMMSTDTTPEIAKSFTAKVFKHKKLSYVEPARNYAISKAKNDWIILLDPDEELPESLKLFLKKEVKEPQADFYRIPRKNVIFGKWMKHTGWWPDMNIRFFKKGSVSWNQIIHSVPITVGAGFDLPLKEEFAIKHKAYTSIEEYIIRMNRYTTVQARELNKNNIEFTWTLLVTKPTSEFLRRFFAEEGYKDGVHGLALSLLQSLSEVVLYAKLWQKKDFKKRKLSLSEFELEFNKTIKGINWWFVEAKLNEINNIFIKLWLKIKRRLR